MTVYHVLLEKCVVKLQLQLLLVLQATIAHR